VVLHDINSAAVGIVNDGRLPFAQDGAGEPLANAVASGDLQATVDPSAWLRRELVVIVGTPVDEHFNPTIGAVLSSSLHRPRQRPASSAPTPQQR
jgi:UDP-N-acetyl-D-mannosaminuronic acid dehydrogenase